MVIRASSTLSSSAANSVLSLLQRLGVLRLLPHFAQGGEVLPCAGELAEAVYLILKLLQPGLNLLGAL